MAKINQYYVTESDLAKLFVQSGLPPEFQRLFVRDYVALKADAGTLEDLVADLTDRADQNDIDIADIKAQLVIDDGRLDSHDTDIAAINVSLNALSVAFNTHVADSSAHGASGDIVGNLNFAAASVGGVVKLAYAVEDQAASTVEVTSSPNAAGVVYVQADAATWVTMLNELKTDVNQLVADLNGLTAKVNDTLASDRSASQRAT